MSCGVDQPASGVVRRRRKSIKDGSTPPVAARSGRRESKAPPPPPPPPPGLIESTYTKTLLASFCIIAVFILILFVQTIAGVGNTCTKASSPSAGDVEGKFKSHTIPTMLSQRSFGNNDVSDTTTASVRVSPIAKAVGRKVVKSEEARETNKRLEANPKVLTKTRTVKQTTTSTTTTATTTTTTTPPTPKSTTPKMPYTKHPDSIVAFLAALDIFQIGGFDVYIDIDLSDVKTKEKVYNTAKKKVTDVLRLFGFLTSFADIKSVEIIDTPPTWKVTADIYLDAMSDAGSLMWFGIPPSSGAPIVSRFEPRYRAYLETGLSTIGVVSKVDTFQVNPLLMKKLQRIHLDHTVELREPSSLIPREWRITDTTPLHLSPGI